MAEIEDFYEDDEPVEHVIQAFERGEKGLTGRATWSDTSYFRLPGRVEKLLNNLSNKSTRELPAH
jgi:hypothetical protein